jgi:thiosulfate/3-mercaptopyruvate sulfurtransferase
MMYRNHMRSRFILPTALSLAAMASLSGQSAVDATKDAPWIAGQVWHSADLARILANPKAQSLKQTPPQILQVGFEVLYKSKHIPGSVYAGPGSKDAGLANLKEAVAALPKDRQIVIYCGCCPWDHCPNIRPAFKMLQSMGFKQIKVLEIPTNFKTDWIDKGFPVEGATAP